MQEDPIYFLLFIRYRPWLSLSISNERFDALFLTYEKDALYSKSFNVKNIHKNITLL
jgi:hypothetical protein